MNQMYDFLNSQLEKRKSEGLLRTLSVYDNVVDFCSNDYLGFAQSQRIRNEADKFFLNGNNGTSDNNYRLLNGSTGSRLLTGNSRLAEEVESYIASFHKAESALIFNSGYDANVGLFSSVPSRGDTVLYDELIHASVRDGIRLGLAKHFSFRHNDVEHVEKRIQQASGNVFVAIESIYSMDGDQAPVRDFVNLCKKYGAHLIVDEAHATGLKGLSGEGLIVAEGLEDYVFARVYTFGKALGCHGAAVVGGNVLRSYLVNYARSFIYSTSLPVHSLLSIRAAYSLLRDADEQRKQVNHLINVFKRYHSEIIPHIKRGESDSPVQCIFVEGNEAAKSVAQRVRESGFDVRAILSPTVPKGKERIRICIHSFNTEGQVRQLVEKVGLYIR